MNGFKQATQAIKAKMAVLNLEMIGELTYQNEVLEQAVKRPISQNDWTKFRNDISHNKRLIQEYTEKVTEYERQTKLLEYGEKVAGY